MYFKNWLKCSSKIKQQFKIIKNCIWNVIFNFEPLKRGNRKLYKWSWIFPEYEIFQIKFNLQHKVTEKNVTRFFFGTEEVNTTFAQF